MDRAVRQRCVVGAGMSVASAGRANAARQHRQYVSSTNTSQRSTSSLSPYVIVVSGLFGFVLSTFVLLLVWTSSLEFASSVSIYSLRNETAVLKRAIPSQNYSTASDWPRWEWFRYAGGSIEKGVGVGKSENKPSQLIIQIATSSCIPSHTTRKDNSSITRNEDEDCSNTMKSAHEKREEAVLAITSHINRAYAKMWQFDYAKVTFPLRSSDKHQQPVSIEQFIGVVNYTSILRKLINDIPLSKGDATMTKRYEGVWVFVDPSTMIVNFEQNVFDHSGGGVLESTSDISGGDGILNEVTLLWNLTHKNISRVLDEWDRSGTLPLGQPPLWMQDGPSPIFNYFQSVEYRSDVTKSAADGTSQNNDVHERSSSITTHSERMRASSHNVSMKATATKAEMQVHSDMLKQLQSVAELICFRYFPRCDVL